MSDPTFNSVRVRRTTAGATEDFLTLDSVSGDAGNGSALRFLNNSATEGLSLTLGRLSVRRADAATVRMDLAVARDPSVSSGDDTPPLLSLVSGAGGPQVTTAAGSTLAAGGALRVSGPTTLSGTLSVTGNATLNGGLGVNGNVSVTGTVDGRDVSSDGTRLDQHLANTANPHATTAAQVGALPLGGGTISGNLRVNGNLGVGVNPDFRLDVADRMRVRQGGAGTAGIWLYQSGPNNDRAFVGMASDSSVGFWGNTGAGWGLTMNTSNGAVSVGNINVGGRLSANNFNAAGHVLVYAIAWWGAWAWNTEASYFLTLNHASRSQFAVTAWAAPREIFYSSKGGTMNVSISSTTDTSTTFRLFVREYHAIFDFFALCVRL